MRCANDEYGSTNNLLKSVENGNSPGPYAESISRASPAVAGMLLLFLYQTHETFVSLIF